MKIVMVVEGSMIFFFEDRWNQNIRTQMNIEQHEPTIILRLEINERNVKTVNLLLFFKNLFHFCERHLWAHLNLEALKYFQTDHDDTIALHSSLKFNSQIQHQRQADNDRTAA